jgi:hypothetical protein
MKTIRSLICIGVGLLVSALNVHAAPYASACSNNIATGTVTYYLNTATAASGVTITTYPSATATVSTGTQGSHTFALGTDTSYSIACTQNGTGTPAIETIASANSANTSWGGSPDPRGMGVNADPTNGPIFGSVYTCNGASGTGHGLGLFPLHSDLSYAFGATSAGLDSATFSGGTGGSAPYKCSVSRYDGSVVVAAIDSVVGQVVQFNGYLQSSSATQLLPKGQNTTGTAVSPYHGEIYGTPKTTGTLGGGNLVLYTFDYTMPTPSAVNSTFGGLSGAIGINSAYWNSAYKTTIVTTTGEWENLNRYTLNGTAPAAALPDLTLNYGSLALLVNDGLPGDIEVNPTNGYLYTTSERAGPGSAPILQIFDSTGATNLYSSAASATVDTIQSALSGVDAGSDEAGCLLRVSADGKYLCLANYFGYLSIFNLTNGIPDITTLNVIKYALGDDPPRGVDWDMADNVYVFNSDTGNLSVYDLGLSETCITSNDSTSLNGSFAVIAPPTATVVATTPLAYQAGNSYAGPGVVTGQYTITLSYAPAIATTVKFTMTGTATNVTTYTLTSSAGSSQLATSPYDVVFPIGTTSETVTLTPGASPAVGPTLTGIMTLTTGGGYGIGSPSSATVSIANSGAETFLVSSGAATMYRGMSSDFVTYTLTRWGDTNTSTAIPTTDFAMTGGAVYGTDYSAGPQPANFAKPATSGPGTSTIPVNPGDGAEYVEVGLPVAHGSFTGNETIILTATSGGGVAFQTGATSATDTLLDNLNPPEQVMWSDALVAGSPSNQYSVNWNVAFSQNTGLLPYQFFFANYNEVPTQDYDVVFGMPLSYDFVPNAPSGATTGLRVTVNKLASGAVGSGTSRAAGVNLYPNTCGYLSNSYAMRFSMNLIRGCADATATEYAIFGINHYGTNVNWIDGSTVVGTGASAFSFTNADGINFSIASDANQFGINGGAGDFFMSAASNYNATAGSPSYFPSTGYLPLPLPASPGLSYASYTNVFKNFGNAYDIADADNGADNGVYNAPNDQFAALNDAGVPASVSGFADDLYATSTSCTPPGNQLVGPWTDVEIKQYHGNVIQLSLNKTVMFTYTNKTIFTNGYPMLGYFDPFDSLGNGGAVYYSNVRVISLDPVITAESISGGTLTINFYSPDDLAVASSFAVYSAPSLNVNYTTNGTGTDQSPPFTVVAGTTITESSGVFTATVPYTGSPANQFYVIKETAVNP